jgi:hypothetical protein
MRPLHQVCKENGIPSEDTVYKWLGRHPEFAEKYTRARQLRAFRRYEEVDKVAEELRLGLIDAQQARVLIDAIKWQTGKENPRIFGDKLELSGNKETPLTVQVINLTQLDDQK